MWGCGIRNDPPAAFVAHIGLYYTAMHKAGLILLGALALAACDDPVSDVGLELLEEGAQPTTHRIEPAVFESDRLNDITGGVTRVLAGRVEDPLFGTVAVNGYVDFAGSWPAINESTITEMELQLKPDYVYGDTAASITLGLHALTESWTAIGAHADMTLPVADEVTKFSFLPTDTLITALLPETWKDAHSETIRSQEFETLFHGFSLKTLSAEAVVGFATEGSQMLIRTEGDSVAYRMSLTFSNIVRETNPVPSDGLLSVQDGAGPSVRLNFDIEEFKELPLNGAMVRVFADTVATQNVPAGFARPVANRLQLLKITAPDDPPTLLAVATLTPDADYRFQGAALRSFFQNALLGLESYTHLELRPPYQEHSLSSIYIREGSAGNGGPEAVLVLSR